MRYGNKTRLPAQVSDWLNPKPAPWWEIPLQKQVDTGTATVTCDVTAHVKGAWVEIIASTSANADAISLLLSVNETNINTASLIDVGIGASGSETAVMENVAVGGHAAYNIYVPLKIPAGSRISLRGQSVRTLGKTIASFIYTFDTGFYDLAPISVDVLGSSTANSASVNLPVNNTYYEIVASTSKTYSSIIAIPSIADPSAVGGRSFIFTAVGASGSEIDINAFYATLNPNEFIQGPSIVGGSNVTIPAGSRLSCKADIRAEDIDVCLIGIPA
jgi:hypothetical protein